MPDEGVELRGAQLAQSLLMTSFMKDTIRFLGGAGTVTGSKFMLTLNGQKVLVDCGLFQGLKELRLQNWEPLPVPPSEIDAVLLTHAHLDHTGYLPILVRDGFKGQVYCTAPTRDLAKVILTDSAKIQEEDAARANLMGFSRHSPAKPLYTGEDVANALRCLTPIGLDVWAPIAEGVKFRFKNSGHILGSALIEVDRV
jgi:metallo-beta-lactamase family protein